MSLQVPKVVYAESLGGRLFKSWVGGRGHYVSSLSTLSVAFNMHRQKVDTVNNPI